MSLFVESEDGDHLRQDSEPTIATAAVASPRDYGSLSADKHEQIPLAYGTWQPHFLEPEAVPPDDQEGGLNYLSRTIIVDSREKEQMLWCCLFLRVFVIIVLIVLLCVLL